VNSDFSSRLNDFAERVILPGLGLVQQYCHRHGHRSWVVPSRPTGDETFDQLLEERIQTAAARALIAALRVECKAVSDSAFGFKRNRFYLAVEGLRQGDGLVVGLPSVFYDQGDGRGFQCFSDGGMPILQPVHLMNTFINRFEAFRMPLLIASAVLQAELIPVAQIKPIRQGVVEGVPPSIPLPVEQSWGEQIRVARRKVEAVQREETETLLRDLKLSETSFRQLWIPDLERGSALSRKMIEKRPSVEGEVQRAFDALVRQAVEFAWSLKPNLFREFADYFELYWTMAEDGCVSDQGLGTDAEAEAAFVTQVVALGEPEDINRVNAAVLRQMQSVVRSIDLKFGRPDAMGGRDLLGFTEISTSLSIERMVNAIQGRSRQFLVRFEELSWGVLQVFQNAGSMPPSERRLGRNLVLSFWRSARLTIERPTEAVVCCSVDAEYFEFRFVRQIEDGQQSRRAIALVRVSQVYGRVVLQTYGFETL
jgi:hypothetical protein